MVVTAQVTRIKRLVDSSEILRKKDSAGNNIELPYSAPNLTTMLTGIDIPIYVLSKVDANGNPYPFTFQARSQAEFTSNFDTTWDLLLGHPDQKFGKL